MKKDNSLPEKLSKNYSIPGQKRLNAAIHSFSPIEHLLFWVLLGIVVITASLMLWKINTAFMVEVPVHDGEITEGVVGAPRSINPITAASDADKDLVSLIYSGLLRPTQNKGYEFDLAESYSISPDGLTYTFHLKDDIVWHDGVPVTSDDVLFTMSMAQNPDIKSPYLANLDNILVEKIDDKTISFTLEESYSPFLENATIGILPKHLWSGEESNFILSNLNQEPIGSGPFAISKIKRDGNGIPTSYELTSFDAYALGKPYIETVRFNFYPNEEDRLLAFKKGDIMNISQVSPTEVRALTPDHYVEDGPLPRVFGAFFNQNEAKVFTDIYLRRALDISIDREKLITSVLQGYATPLDQPLPPGSFAYTPYVDTFATTSTATGTQTRIERAREILEDGGWKMNEETNIFEKKISGSILPLTFTISTSDIPELKHAAEILRLTWKSIGAEAAIKIYEEGNITHHVIRPREYEVLLFGEIIGRHSDPYAFWHSSQRLDPGLNIALYTNIASDKALDKARATTSIEARIEQYKLFQEEIKSDVPAIFLYAPHFIYIIDPSIKNIDIGPLSSPSERFIGIENWYMQTEHIWQSFIKPETITISN